MKGDCIDQEYFVTVLLKQKKSDYDLTSSIIRGAEQFDLFQQKFITINLIQNVFAIWSHRKTFMVENISTKFVQTHERETLNHFEDDKLQKCKNINLIVKIYDRTGHEKGKFVDNVSPKDLNQYSLPSFIFPYKSQVDVFAKFWGKNITISVFYKDHEDGVKSSEYLFLQAETHIDLKEKRIYQEFSSLDKGAHKYLGSCSMFFEDEIDLGMSALFYLIKKDEDQTLLQLEKKDLNILHPSQEGLFFTSSEIIINSSNFIPNAFIQCEIKKEEDLMTTFYFTKEKPIDF